MASEDLIDFNQRYSTRSFALDLAVSRQLTKDTRVVNDHQEVPSEFCSPQEAQEHIQSAHNLRIQYQDMKAESLCRLQKLIDYVKWIDDKILEVDIRIGRISHVADESGVGFPPIVTRKERVVTIDHGEYHCYRYYCIIESP
jgi:hypothetical protein